jgi:hypothetical protein
MRSTSKYSFNKKQTHSTNKFGNSHKLDCIDLSETHLTSKDEHMNKIDGFNILRCDRIGQDGGGAAILLRVGIKYKIIKKKANSDMELIAIELKFNKFSTIIACVYINPTSKTNFDFIDELLAINKNVILLGDFNSKHILWGCPPPIDVKGKRLEEKLQQHSLVILNDETPTFSKSLNVLDLIIASPGIVNSLSNFRVI